MDIETELLEIPESEFAADIRDDFASQFLI